MSDDGVSGTVSAQSAKPADSMPGLPPPKPIMMKERSSVMYVEREVRLNCRDMFRRTNLLERLIPMIDEVVSAGGIEPPEAHEEAVPIAIPNKESIGDAGHRG